MEIDRAIELAIDGKALLFTGAGFSSGAVNLKNLKFRNVSELVSYFAQKSGLPDSVTLDDASEEYVNQVGIDQLINELKQEFTVKDIATFHKIYAEIPWKRIYTTNYDNVVEDAYRKVGRLLTPVTLGYDIFSIPKESICVHMNGYIQTLDRKSIWNEFKLTETSYLTASISTSKWAILFRNDLRYARSVFFIGYSLYDIDIKRMLFDVHGIKDKCFFILGNNPDDSLVRRVSKIGSIVKESVETFSQRISEKRKVYIPVDTNLFEPSAILEHKIQSSNVTINDQDFLNLMLFGIHDTEKISSSLNFNYPFYLTRSSTDRVYQYICGGKKIVIVCSDLGNGKTLFMDGLLGKALADGWRVFEAHDYSEEAANDMHDLSKLHEKSILIIEDYHNWLDEIKDIVLNTNDNLRLVLTARNAINDVVIDKLIDLSKIKEIPEIRLDILDDNEINWIIETWNTYGLWADKAGWTKRRKFEYLSKDCNNQFHSILLKLIDSPDIKERLKNLYSQIKDTGEYSDVIITIFVLSVLNQNPTIDLLVDLWGDKVLNNPGFKRNPLINQLINFNNNQIIVRSAVAALHFLREVLDANTIVSVVTDVTNKLNNIGYLSKRYHFLRTELMRFHNVQLILPEKGFAKAMINYYESIKNLPYLKNNGLFWLQYAIGCTVVEDFLRARMYFKTAYSLAEAKSWDSRQIDNHYARFLIDEAIESSDPVLAMQSFRKARRIIFEQIKTERRKYPYNVARRLDTFIDKYDSQLSIDELKELAKMAHFIIKNIKALPDFVSCHKNVRHCHKTMTYIIERVKEYTIDEIEED